jgi:glycosyltransferase involved in cell wall biosynthesis
MMPAPLLLKADVRIYVSCYNYREFLRDCLGSIRSQTFPDFHCVVVDDGSQDGSYEEACRVAEGDARFQVLSQGNAGQLSVFNRAASECDEQDIVFFLDADDAWQPRHIETVLTAMAGDLADCDLVFTGHRKTDTMQCETRPNAGSKGHVRLGLSSGVTRAFRYWIGSVTSTICVRGHLLKRILPYPFAHEWKVRADDCLVYGSSIAGARKGFVDADTVLYRVHENNNFFNKPRNRPDQIATYSLAVERYMEWLCARESLPRIPPSYLVLLELQNAGQWQRFNACPIRPMSALVTPWPLYKRLQVFLSMWSHRS